MQTMTPPETTIMMTAEKAAPASGRRRNDEIPNELPDLTKPQLLDYGQVARVTGLSVPTLERYVRRGKLRPAPGLGRSVRFPSAELLRLVNGETV
jgi:excisionase family DNA binding protein